MSEAECCHRLRRNRDALEVKDWGDFLKQLEALGRVMALTRNDRLFTSAKAFTKRRNGLPDKMALLVTADIDCGFS